MSRSTKWKILFCFPIIVGMCDAVVRNQEIFRGMSLQERLSFFGTDDVPELEVVKLPKSSRPKREVEVERPDIDTLTIQFKYHDADTTTTVNYTQDQKFISQYATAVWFAETNSQAHHDIVYTPQPDILSGIGIYHLFQNKDDCSAIMEIYKHNSGETYWMGVLRQDYTLRTIPRDYRNGFRYINRTHSNIEASESLKNDQDMDSSSYAVIFKHEKPPQEYFRRKDPISSLAAIGLDNGQSQFSSQSTAPSNPPSIVYPKLLITPDYDLVSSEKSLDEFLTLLIAYLNVMNMMYNQLSAPEVHLRIGGIIIPRDSRATPYIVRDSILTTGSLDINEVLKETRIFFESERCRLKANTYTAVIALTKHKLHDYDDKTRSLNILGAAIPGSGCRSGRAIVHYDRNFNGVLTIAHELGHVFNAGHDKGHSCSNDDGYTMVPDAGFARTLKWSPCTRTSFSKFFRSQQAKCTHTEPPVISGWVAKLPGSWLDISGQCDNHMKGDCLFCINTSLECRNYGCSRNCIWTGEPLMNGTLLNKKRCLNGDWV